ncbi:LCP family protein [Streptomyces sp. NPDC052610]|uniref:LCP family protein n=1 Tax=Streptomyces sp. NPDC052610 TaxID=3154952 RepID=UPI0034366353
MNDWPEGWSDDNRGSRYGRGSAGAQPEGARVMRQVRRGGPAVPPASGPAAPPYNPGVPRQPSYVDGGEGDFGGYDSGYNTGQVYGTPGGQGPSGPDGPRGRGPRPAPNWRRRIKVTAVTLATVLIVTTVGTYFWADSKLNRDVDLSTVIDRPEKGEGTNYLIVGSDSREGMTDEQKKELHTGSAEGKRTDSMMILHTGDNGPTLISLPRDSNVTIPEFQGSESGKRRAAMGANKLNAAYSIDGPTLLVRTVEFNTGLHIDHYVEIGFAGFANIVDAVGGVEMDIPQDIKDTKSGANFEKGKQTLNGEEALAFVRTRYALAGSDLDRTKNQQKFLNALASQVATPGTILNPFKLYPTMGAGLDSLVVDKDMGLYDLASMFWAMKGVSGGDGKSMNMPIAGNAANGNLQWDMTKVETLVDQLKNDEKVTVSGN